MSPINKKIEIIRTSPVEKRTRPHDEVTQPIAVTHNYPPVWKSAFTLSQNVRFTRTPEVEIIRRRVAIDPAFAQRFLQAKGARQAGDISHDVKNTAVNKVDAATNDDMPKWHEGHSKPESIAKQQNSAPSEDDKGSVSSNFSASPHQRAELSIEPRDNLAISDFAFFDAGLTTTQLVTLQGRSAASQDANHGTHSTPRSSLDKDDSQSAIIAQAGNGASITELFRVLDYRFSAPSPQPQPIKTDIADGGSGWASKPTNSCDFTDDGRQVCDRSNGKLTKALELNNPPVASRSPADSGPLSDSVHDSIVLEESTPSYPELENQVEKCNDAEALAAKTFRKDRQWERVGNHILSSDEAEPMTPMSNAERLPVHPSTEVPPAIGEGSKRMPVISPRTVNEKQVLSARTMHYLDNYQFPDIELLQPPLHQDVIVSQESLEQSAGLLESVLEDFGIKGEIIHVRPGPVVTLYEFEPAAGVKSSRVIGISDDIARSMSAIAARVAVIPGRNVIGIELPNQHRETVYLRELLESKAFTQSSFRLALALGKNIGGEPVIAELAKMPHLLVAGTTGSGKSVAINTMILSLLYRMTPEQCRLIMVDPKMLELSIYEGIPHLLTPVVTDPKKAVTALKWAVREMENRYRKMAKLSVRNIDGFNMRIQSAIARGEKIHCTVQAGFDKETGELQYQQEEMELVKLPYIVVIVDEMADLMMLAGKEIEGAIQRLAQMARAAGIHLIMATQRPSVDVITGTIKANFPTRISFQVTSKIDSRTILGEQGAETLLGQGDMLHMAGGGRIVRVHGPFVSDEEVEKVVAHLKTQGKPEYLANVTDGTEDDDNIEDADSVAEILAAGNGTEDSEELYLQAVKIVMRDKKCSTSYIQRRLNIGYNKAATLVERMEEEGIVGAANHVGKREILVHRT